MSDSVVNKLVEGISCYQNLSTDKTRASIHLKLISEGAIVVSVTDSGYTVLDIDSVPVPVLQDIYDNLKKEINE